jgi:hypothetical protein
LRSTVVTALVASAVVAIVLGVGWLVQSASLPAPARADVIAADAATWLSRYRLVESTLKIGSDPSSHETCLAGWFPAPGDGLAPGLVLRFGRSRIVEVRGRTTQVPAAGALARPRVTVLRVALAGCPRFLARRIAGRIDSGAKLRIERATVAGRPALALPISFRGLRLRIYLTPLTYRPIAVSANADGLVGESRIHLTTLTPSLLQAVGLSR